MEIIVANTLMESSVTNQVTINRIQKEKKNSTKPNCDLLQLLSLRSESVLLSLLNYQGSRQLLCAGTVIQFQKSLSSNTILCIHSLSVSVEVKFYLLLIQEHTLPRNKNYSEKTNIILIIKIQTHVLSLSFPLGLCNCFTSVFFAFYYKILFKL